MRWGVISTAAINDLVLPGFARSERADLVAVASRSEERAAAYAAEHEIPRGYGSYEELLGDDQSRGRLHLPSQLPARRVDAQGVGGGQARSLREAADAGRRPKRSDLFALAEERSLLLMEAFMYRHHPQTQWRRDLIRGGEIGEPLIVRSWFHFEVEDPATDVRYRADLAGGALRDVGCYCVSFCNYLLEAAPARVSSVAHWADSGVDQRFAASMAYENGALATFDCSIQAPLHIGLTVLGSRGALHIPTPWYPHEPPMRIVLNRGEATQQVAAEGEDSYFLEIENFTAAADGRRRTRGVGSGETVRNLQTIDRLIAAAATRRARRKETEEVRDRSSLESPVGSGAARPAGASGERRQHPDPARLLRDAWGAHAAGNRHLQRDRGLQARGRTRRHRLRTSDLDRLQPPTPAPARGGHGNDHLPRRDRHRRHPRHRAVADPPRLQPADLRQRPYLEHQGHRRRSSATCATRRGRFSGCSSPTASAISA